MLLRPIGVRLATSFLAAALGCSPLSAQQTPNQLRIVDLQGTPYEIGLQHGQTLAAEIKAQVAAFEADLQQMAGEPASTFVPRFLRETQYEAAARRWCPSLLDELRGIATGAQQPFETMFVYQLADELWAQTPAMKREKCTSLGIARHGDQPTITAQNIDVPQWMRTNPTVLRIRHPDSSRQELVATLPGMLGAMGMNSGRVAVAVNTILQLAPCRDGLPVTFVVRGLLDQPDDAAARAFLLRVPHASGQAYTIGGPATVTCHEASAHKVVPFVPASGPDRVWHTNHPVASDDWNPAFVASAQKAGKEPAAVKFGCSRFAAVVQVLGGGEPAGLEQCVALLADPKANVCNAMTYMCVVMTLGEQPEMRVTPGAPNQAAMQTVAFAPAK